jgi:hypothetical protein
MGIKFRQKVADKSLGKVIETESYVATIFRDCFQNFIAWSALKLLKDGNIS